jgi:hypothetical protein
MDWALFHFLNGLLRGHLLVGDEIEDFVTFWAVPLFALATVSLWFFDRPGPWYRWKIACISGLASAGRWVGIVAALSRATDPLIAPAWRALDAQKRRRSA